MRCMVAVLVHVDRFQCRIDTAADFCGLNTEVFRAECHVFLNNTRDKLVIRVLLHKAHAAAHVKLRFLHGGIDASTVTVPEVGTNIPLNSFAMVDLPQPLWPSSATNEPFSMSRSTPCRTSPLSPL